VNIPFRRRCCNELVESGQAGPTSCRGRLGELAGRDHRSQAAPLCAAPDSHRQNPTQASNDRTTRGWDLHRGGRGIITGGRWTWRAGRSPSSRAHADIQVGQRAWLFGLTEGTGFVQMAICRVRAVSGDRWWAACYRIYSTRPDHQPGIPRRGLRQARSSPCRTAKFGRPVLSFGSGSGSNLSSDMDVNRRAGRRLRRERRRNPRSDHLNPTRTHRGRCGPREDNPLADYQFLRVGDGRSNARHQSSQGDAFDLAMVDELLGALQRAGKTRLCAVWC
jgi:hypothetical protein